ncbi:outer membrane biogenesis protein BamB [Novipirellula galeiformis]|uniref:Outer membrane biogenesis protein BamB n=2 Tax=Novipirellula galeiformis TaxID=2528004 RepID=A0A5C6CEK9_9BACT|nr:outer membrane biogenesis protein BamB [Novipirellula galeiformis]
MKHSLLLLSMLAFFSFFTAEVAAQDWPQWRGPASNNHAATNAQAPLRWDITSSSDLAWKTQIPGRGHSTPCVVQDSIYLTTADTDAGTQSVLKLDRISGRLVDQWVIHRGTLPAQIHPHNSHASPSPAFADNRLFVAFHTDDAIWVTALTREGRELWKRKVSDFAPVAFQFGYGASPIVEDDLVIVAAEYDGAASGLYALDAATGNQVWKVPRPANLNFASPIVTTISGKRQILLAGADMICAYEPRTGKELWRSDTSTEAICGTVVWDEHHIMVSGGNPKAGVWCIGNDGSGAPLWEHPVRCYEQSLLAIKDYVFAAADNGVVYCWRSQDGKEMWKKRLFGGGISASPMLVGNRMYIASEDGDVYVVTASPEGFNLLAENPSGDSIFATPVAIDDRMLIRTGVGPAENRQEYLIAIGKK